MMSQNQLTEWTGCYDDSWKELIVDEAFAHPAKIARGLVRRIYSHLRERYGLAAGAVVVDPFGGIAGTALDAMLMGCRWYGCELEAKANGGSPFVELGNENIAKWSALGMPGTAVLVQGDSRRLVENLSGVMASVCVSSPPFIGGSAANDRQDKYDGFEHVGSVKFAAKDKRAQKEDAYGSAPGQLGSMKSGSVDAVISSPPYADAVRGDNAERETAAESRDKRNTPGGSTGRSVRFGGYGVSDGNLAGMAAGDADAVISSPPYAETAVAKNSDGVDLTKQYETYRAQGGGASFEKFCATQRKHSGGYGSSNGNLSAMQAVAVADALVSSPPYEHCLDDRGRDPEKTAKRKDRFTAAHPEMAAHMQKPVVNYGGSEGNIGHEHGDTFWSASRLIVEQCHAILKPGGLAIWVVKAFVRNKAIVDFPGDWQRLCEACGFETVEIVHASLVKETRTPDLFGGEHVKKTERKSFFRRLAEKKGSPEINAEVVLFTRKPTCESA